MKLFKHKHRWRYAYVEAKTPEGNDFWRYSERQSYYHTHLVCIKPGCEAKMELTTKARSNY